MKNAADRYNQTQVDRKENAIQREAGTNPIAVQAGKTVRIVGRDGTR
jgi:hypothetical protein